jgi:GT2 family glycosyltransferase
VAAAAALAVVVVAHNSAADLPELIPALLEQLESDDELLIVDNASSDQTAAIARQSPPPVRLLRNDDNLGFGGGAHTGARATSAPLLLFLNPDCRPERECLAELRDAAAAHPAWGAWQPAVMLPDGAINTDGGVVHYSGIGWAGDCGRPATALPVTDREVTFPSGAAMVVRREVWERLGGFEESYFLYSEDLDLGLRLWLAGYGIGIVPSARIVHGYEFEKGSYKWFLLERNRWHTILAVYPLRLLLLLAPALLAAEVAVLAIATLDGWLGAKLRAQLAVLSGLPSILARRRTVQSTRQIDTRAFASHLTASLDSSYLPIRRARWAARAQARYWTLVERAL